jgi:PAS domain S-box-containing protein
VKNLAEVLQVQYSFVAEFAEVKTRVRTLAYWGAKDFLPNVEYNLSGTPCEAVLRGEIQHYTDQVDKLFPLDIGLVRRRAKGYLAIPMMDPGGNVLGHLTAFDNRPLLLQPRDLSIFRIFAARATAEMLRKQLERQQQVTAQALRESETRLATILASAMDAVITFDDDHHIVLFNPAAEKMFHCSAQWARGQPFDRFLSKRFRSLLENYLRQLDTGVGSSNQLWAPDGLTALRADGEEFPIETTISAMRLSNQRLYTVILRDVNERRKAEQILRRLAQENRYLQDQLEGGDNFESIIGNTAAMQGVFEHIQKVAGSDTTVLVLGETGTGKELLARAVHNLSTRKDKLLVKMNCAALPSELIESELFGHEKGAFTGATAQRKGRFELADGGTLFLDEVGELSATAQAKLLRVLQEQEFERVGGSRPIKVDVRVIAATNRDLAAMVKRGEFRADLYYRLNVFPLRIPPLRERHEDIPVLARHFLRQLARKLGKPLADIAPRSLTRLQIYPWPGNVRELQNVIERAAVLAGGPLVDIDDALEMRFDLPADGEASQSAGLNGTLEEVERSYITQVLETTRWTIEGDQGAAAILALHPSTLRSRMQKLGIKRPQLR